MDWTSLGAILANIVVGFIAAWTARRAHKSGKQLREQTRKLDVLTDAQLNQRIYDTVVEVLAAEQGDALRTLMRSILRRAFLDSNE